MPSSNSARYSFVNVLMDVRASRPSISQMITHGAEKRKHFSTSFEQIGAIRKYCSMSIPNMETRRDELGAKRRARRFGENAMPEQRFSFEAFTERLGVAGQYAQQQKIVDEFGDFRTERVVVSYDNENRVIEVMLEYYEYPGGKLQTRILPREYFS